jgi:hypothetical protein
MKLKKNTVKVLNFIFLILITTNISPSSSEIKYGTSLAAIITAVAIISNKKKKNKQMPSSDNEQQGSNIPTVMKNHVEIKNEELEQQKETNKLEIEDAEKENNRLIQVITDLEKNTQEQTENIKTLQNQFNGIKATNEQQKQQFYSQQQEIQNIEQKKKEFINNYHNMHTLTQNKEAEIQKAKTYFEQKKELFNYDEQINQIDQKNKFISNLQFNYEQNNLNRMKAIQLLEFQNKQITDKFLQEKERSNNLQGLLVGVNKKSEEFKNAIEEQRKYIYQKKIELQQLQQKQSVEQTQQMNFDTKSQQSQTQNDQFKTPEEIFNFIDSKYKEMLTLYYSEEEINQKNLLLFSELIRKNYYASKEWVKQTQSNSSKENLSNLGCFAEVEKLCSKINGDAFLLFLEACSKEFQERYKFEGEEAYESQPTFVFKAKPGEEFNICGDPHGSTYTILHAIQCIQTGTPFIIDGDVMDRGIKPFLSKVNLVQSIMFNALGLRVLTGRGNHEFLPSSEPYWPVFEDFWNGDSNWCTNGAYEEYENGTSGKHTQNLNYHLKCILPAIIMIIPPDENNHAIVVTHSPFADMVDETPIQIQGMQGQACFNSKIKRNIVPDSANEYDENHSTCIASNLTDIYLSHKGKPEGYQGRITAGPKYANDCLSSMQLALNMEKYRFINFFGHLNNYALKPIVEHYEKNEENNFLLALETEVSQLEYPFNQALPYKIKPWGECKDKDTHCLMSHFSGNKYMLRNGGYSRFGAPYQHVSFGDKTVVETRFTHQQI